MGNFHCISKGCAEVVYRPYESARVRWRYPGEQWQQVEADDYTIDNLPGQCCHSYDVTVSYEIAHCKDSKAEAERMCGIAAQLIHNDFLELPPRIYVGERKGQAVSVDPMIPAVIQYFELGQQNTIPTWRVRVANLE